jgi:hypothetical protein
MLGPRVCGLAAGGLKSTWKPHPTHAPASCVPPNTPISYLSSFKGVFTVAVQSILIDENPMDKVAIGSKVESKRQSYSVDQVILILNRAQAKTDDIFLPLVVQELRQERRPREGDTGKMVPVYQ